MSKYVDIEPLENALKAVEKRGEVAVLLDELLSVIAKYPTADVAEVKHGRWKNGKCSICEADEPYTESGFWIETPYCPNCGASMVNEDE